ACCFGGPARSDLGVRVALEYAEAAFAQSLIGLDVETDPIGNGLRRVEGARQIAGEDGFDALAGQRFGDAPGLPAATPAQHGVELSLHAHFGIPYRLAVTDRDDARHLRVLRIGGHAAATRSGACRRYGRINRP